MNDLETPIHPVSHPRYLRRGSVHNDSLPHKKGRDPTPSVLTGINQIALTRLGWIHLLSMMLMLSD